MNVQHANTASDAEIDFGRLIAAVYQARYWILVAVLATAVTTLIGVNLVSSKYRAEAEILIESNESIFTGKERGQEEDRALLDQQGINSQVQLLSSRDLARTVIKKFNLVTINEFNPIGRILFSDLLASIGLAEKAAPEEDVLVRYFERLEVFEVERSRVIKVRFWTEDPELSARITNGIVEEYFRIQAEAKRSNTRHVMSVLQPEIERLEREARDAQRRVAEFRSGADLLLGADNQTLSQQQLAELNSQLSAARAAKSDAEAKASLIRELLRSGSALETATDVLSSQLIQRLRERQVALKARIAELSTTLLPEHPEIKGMRSQLADLERQIAAEATKIVRGYESEARLAEARMQSLSDNLNELKAQAARSNEQQVRLGELQRDAAVKTARLETLMSQFREVETRQTAEALPVDARRISSATPPVDSFSPRRGAITLGATLAALLLSLGFVVMREFLTGNVFTYYRRAGEPAPDLPLEAGMDPLWDNVRREIAAPRGEDDEIFADGGDNVTPLADAGRSRHPGGTLRTALDHLVQPFRECYEWLEENDLRCTIVASRDEAEVAADTALELARETTEGDRSCVLILLRGEVDAIGDGTAHTADGFAELVTGTASFADVIYQDTASRTHIIPRGGADIAMDEIDADEFGFLIDALEQTYDRVIVAVGPLGADLGTVDLLRNADSVVLAVSPGVDDKWGLAAFETLTAHGFAHVFVASEPAGSALSPAA